MRASMSAATISNCATEMLRLLQALRRPGEQLLAIEVLAPPVLLDDLHGRQLDRLDRREALAASDALAPAADTVVVSPAVRHLGVAEVADMGTASNITPIWIIA